MIIFFISVDDSPKFSDSDSDEPVLDPRQATSQKRKSVAPPPDYPHMEVDLPPELLERGWRKYWSRRENRPYFFNLETGVTLWNQPEILPEPGKPGATGHVKKLRQKVVIIAHFCNMLSKCRCSCVLQFTQANDPLYSVVFGFSDLSN